jgi:signal transduction histidine kinase
MGTTESTLDETRLERLIEVGRSLVTELDPEAVIAQALSVARDLTGAKYAAIGVLNSERTGLERFLTEGLDAEQVLRIGDPPRGKGILGLLIDHPEPIVLEDVGLHPASFGFPPNHPPMKTFLGVPVRIHGRPWGNLYLTEKDDGSFTEVDEQSAVILAEWIAIAIKNARSMAAERVQLSFEAAEQERRRWARELHDETLQNLAGLRVLLSAAKRHADTEPCIEVIDQSVERVDETIAEMRRLIADLRPAALDQLGVAPALTALIERVQSDSGVSIDLRVDLAPADGSAGARLVPQLEDTIYRLVQESLNNAIRHGDAKRAIVEVFEEAGGVTVRVVDDGTGFDPKAPKSGYGLTGMKERVALCGGELEVSSGTSGSTIQASMKSRRVGQPA